MNAVTPHYLLFSESCGTNQPGEGQRGRWRFVLESLDGAERFEASDEETGATAQRLELLAVVRGLEALDQPSRVTLVTSSSYVSRGIRFGLAEWRENNWTWERFGKMTPVKDDDLWRRVDQALRFHQVECRTWRFQAPAPVEASRPAPAADVVAQPAAGPVAALLRGLTVAIEWLEGLLDRTRRFLEPGPQRLSLPS